MDAIDQVFDPLRDFSKDSIRLVKRCHKPDRKGSLFHRFEISRVFYFQIFWFVDFDFDFVCLIVEFTKVAFRTAVGFVVMGFVGFFVKLIFIPINNIIVGSTWLVYLILLLFWLFVKRLNS